MTVVQLDGDYKIAQYGQWDGYPTGQGKTVLEFLKRLGVRKRKAFEQKLRATSFATDEDLDKVNAAYPNGGWQKVYPAYSRDTGAKILELVAVSDAGIKLKNDIEFAGASLFCEYAYVIDLDKNVLEVYKGFNKRPLTKSARFYGTAVDSDAPKYFQIRLKAKWPLDALPTVAEMDKKVG